MWRANINIPPVTPYEKNLYCQQSILIQLILILIIEAASKQMKNIDVEEWDGVM